MLGPSCILVARRLLDWLDAADAALQVPLELLARTVGLGAGTGRGAPVVRTLARLVDFAVAAIEHETLALRIPFPPLGQRQVGRLPEYLAIQHADQIARHACNDGRWSIGCGVDERGLDQPVGEAGAGLRG